MEQTDLLFRGTDIYSQLFQRLRQEDFVYAITFLTVMAANITSSVDGLAKTLSSGPCVCAHGLVPTGCR